jgi:hypothetical protein
MVLVQTMAPWVAKRTRHAADSSNAQHWAAVAALAASMPPAYSNMADQLGCGREVVLLMAGVVAHLDEQQRTSQVMQCLEEVVFGSKQHRHAALLMALPAVVLQWLSDMSPRQMLNRAEQCAKACSWGFVALAGAGTLADQQSDHAALELLNTARAPIPELCLTLLQKLLAVWRSLTVAEADTQGLSASVAASGNSSSGSSGRSSSSSSRSGNSHMASDQASNSNSLMHVRTLRYCLILLLCKLFEAQSRHSAGGAAGAAESAGADSRAVPAGRAAAASPTHSHQPPAAALCSVLQQLVRQEAAAGRNGEEVGADVLGSPDDVMMSICSLIVMPQVMGSTWTAQPNVAAGQLDSPDALQLLGLLYSLLKAINSTSQLFTVTSKLVLIEAVSRTAGAVLGTALAQAPPGDRVAAPATSSSAAVILPWLVLLGRCAAAIGAQAGAAPAPSLDSTVRTALSRLTPRLRDVEGWLQAGPTAEELSAMGYEPEALLDQLSEAVAPSDTELLSVANCAASGAEGQARADKVLSALRDWLQAVGTLTSFAVPHCCNNPACVNTAGPSEAQLVNGRGNLCGGCRVARYCSRSCLRQHWRQHKPVCKALAAAAAAAAQAAQ